VLDGVEAALIDVLAFESIIFNLLFLALLTRGLPLPLGNFDESIIGLTSMGGAVNNKLGLSGQSSTSSKNTSVFELFATDSGLSAGGSWGFMRVVEFWQSSSLITTLQNLKQESN
jgi:hypothetical protein